MKRVKDEKGVITVFIALFLLVFLAMIALVMDGGQLYWKKLRIQNAVDAAALAGAQELPMNQGWAKDEAVQTARANGIPSENVRVTFNDTYTTITVNGQTEVHHPFARLFGHPSTVLTAIATAELRPIKTMEGIIPLGVDYRQQLVYGEQVTLKTEAPDVGFFGILILTGLGAKKYEDDLMHGFDGEVSIGQILETQTGRIHGKTEKAIQERIADCPDATYMNVPSNCARVVVVPVYKPYQHNQKQLKQVEVVGFASFFLESVGHKAEVTGRFLQKTYEGKLDDGNSEYGVYGYHLVK